MPTWNDILNVAIDVTVEDWPDKINGYHKFKANFKEELNGQVPKERNLVIDPKL